MTRQVGWDDDSVVHLQDVLADYGHRLVMHAETVAEGKDAHVVSPKHIDTAVFAIAAAYQSRTSRFDILLAVGMLLLGVAGSALVTALSLGQEVPGALWVVAAVTLSLGLVLVSFSVARLVAR